MANKRLHDAADRVFRTVQNAARKEIEEDREGTNVNDLLAHANQLTDSVIREVVDAEPTTGRPACCEGCAACCHLHIVAFPVEVVAIAKEMRDQMSPEHLADVIDRIDVHIERTTGLDASERRQIRLACPLLEAGRCAIYSFRPISCRGWNSLDRSACDADLANPSANVTTPVNIGQYVLAGRVAEGLGAASHSLGLDSRQVDFVRALRIAMEATDTIARAWRSGLDVFGESVNEKVFPGPQDSDQASAREALWQNKDEE